MATPLTPCDSSLTSDYTSLIPAGYGNVSRVRTDFRCAWTVSHSTGRSVAGRRRGRACVFSAECCLRRFSRTPSTDTAVHSCALTCGVSAHTPGARSFHRWCSGRASRSGDVAARASAAPRSSQTSAHPSGTWSDIHLYTNEHTQPQLSKWFT